MTCATPGWQPHAIFLCGFVLQLYWSQTALLFDHELLCHSYTQVDRHILKDILSSVQRRLSGTRLVDGVLQTGSVGLHPMKNPMERRSGSVRYLQLADECNQWAIVTDEFQTYVESETCMCTRMLEIIRTGGLRAYRGTRNYGIVRLIRALMTISGGTISYSESCWSCPSGMSRHQRGITRQHGFKL